MKIKFLVANRIIINMITWNNFLIILKIKKRKKKKKKIFI